MTKMRTEWPLRLGCGLVNLYSGFFLLIDPKRYYKYVPGWLSYVANAVASLDAYLRFQGIGEMVVGVCLFGLFFPPLVCARGSHTAYGPNDTHSHLQWS